MVKNAFVNFPREGEKQTIKGTRQVNNINIVEKKYKYIDGGVLLSNKIFKFKDDKESYGGQR